MAWRYWLARWRGRILPRRAGRGHDGRDSPDVRGGRSRGGLKRRGGRDGLGGGRPGERPPKDRPFPTRVEGLWVRSHGEQRVADWLDRRGVPFRYEPKVCGKRPDFQIEGHKVLVEYWGGAGFPGYEARMLAKIERFEAAGWTVVSLFSIHLHELEQVLERELRKAGVAA